MCTVEYAEYLRPDGTTVAQLPGMVSKSANNMTSNRDRGDDSAFAHVSSSAPVIVSTLTEGVHELANWHDYLYLHLLTEPNRISMLHYLRGEILSKMGYFTPSNIYPNVSQGRVYSGEQMFFKEVAGNSGRQLEAAKCEFHATS